jgi:putative flippase GtrA
MVNLFFKLSEKLRYLMIGGLNTIIGYLIFISLTLILEGKINYIFIVLLNYVFGFNVSFFNFKYFVFKSKKRIRDEYFKTINSYILLFFINSFLMIIFQEILKVGLILSQGIIIIFMTIITYLIHKNYSFKKESTVEK